MNQAIIIAVIQAAIAAAARAYAAFEQVNGRPPTLEEWQALQKAWKTPDEIEAEVRAQLSPSPEASANPGQ